MSSHSNTFIYNSQPSEESEDQQQVQMLIQLDNNNSAILKICPYDDAFTLATKFCYQYSIDPKVIQILTKNIKQVQKSHFLEQNYQTMIRNKENNKKQCNSYSKDYSLSKSLTTHQCRSTITNDETEFDHLPSHKQMNVFQRLYQARKPYTKRVQKSCQSVSSVNLSQSFDLNNSQIQIYLKNTRMKEETLKKNQQKKYKKQQQEVSELTLKPKINDISNIVATRLHQQNKYPKKQYHNLNRTIQSIKEKEIEEIKECTFHPKIIYKGNSTHSKRFQKLHEDSIVREQKSKEKQQNYLKSEERKRYPKINAKSKQIIDGKSFYERLNYYNEKSKENKNKIKQANAHHYAPKTGKKPKNRNRQGQDVGNYLYSKARKVKIQYEVKNKPQFINSTSNKIYEEVKINAFRYLFALMDSDEDGLISSYKINIVDFDVPVLQILSPLLNELDDLGIELSEEEFMQSIQRLFSALSPPEKHKLLNAYKNEKLKAKNQDELTFHPVLNEKSLVLAKEGRDSDMDIYELGKILENQKESRLKELRALKELIEYEECTFHPNLFHHHF